MKYLKESSSFSDMLKDDEFVALYKKYNWEEANSPSTYNGMIFRKDTNEFVGKICMQFTDREVPELGIDIMNAMKSETKMCNFLSRLKQWLFQRKNCHHFCLRCEYFEMCKEEG